MSQEVISFSSPRHLFGKCLNLEESQKSGISPLRHSVWCQRTYKIRTQTQLNMVLLPGVSILFENFWRSKTLFLFFLKANFNISGAECKHLTFFKMMLKTSKVIFKISNKCIHSPQPLGGLGWKCLKSTKSKISNLAHFYNLPPLSHTSPASSSHFSPFHMTWAPGSWHILSFPSYSFQHLLQSCLKSFLRIQLKFYFLFETFLNRMEWKEYVEALISYIKSSIFTPSQLAWLVGASVHKTKRLQVQ